MADATPKKTKITTPDFALSQKIGKEVDLNTVFTEDRIEASQAEVVKVQEGFLDKVAHKVEEMQKSFDNDASSDITKETLMSQSFMVKGQAESLGYSLLAHIAKSLCDYTEAHLQHDEDKARNVIVTKHFNAMHIIIKDKIKGDGAKLGEELLKNLQLLIAKYHPAS